MEVSTLLPVQDQTSHTAATANPPVQKNHLPAYTLPLEKGTVKLTLNTLNRHSAFRLNEQTRLKIKTRMVSYHNSVLTIGISFLTEQEQFIYLTVQQNELKVSCSTDTTEDYLSRHAYFALNRLMSIYREYNFEKYYWPDFFNTQTGESDYLAISNDEDRIAVSLKPEYAAFYKPGQQLSRPVKETIKNARPTVSVQKEKVPGNVVTGYCIADTALYSLHSNHFPFLIPYLGTATKNKDSIKGFTKYLQTPQDTPLEGSSPAQLHLNALCHRMTSFAEIMTPEYNASPKEKQEIAMKNLNNAQQLFVLWQKALFHLAAQPFTHYLYTYGMKNITGKPRLKRLHPCTFSTAVPKPCFYLTDLGDYYELEMKFKAGRKIFNPHPASPAFFINGKNDPANFYLLDSLSDYRLTAFFAHTGFKISILKCHYQQHFKRFTEQLAAIYDLQVITSHPVA